VFGRTMTVDPFHWM